MRATVSIFLFAMLIFNPNYGRCEELLPTPETIQKNFKAAQNENQRYLVFNELGPLIQPLGNHPDLKSYVIVLNELAEFSTSLGDANWVSQKGYQLIQQVSEIKIKNIMKESGALQLEGAFQDDFVYFFIKTSEGFQFTFLSASAREAVLGLNKTEWLEKAYIFITKLEVALASPVDYIRREFVSLLASIAYLYSREYLTLNSGQLEVWLPRMSSDGIQRILNDFENQILSATPKDQVIIEKIIVISQSFYRLLFERYKNDYLNDWQYLRCLKIIGIALYKFEGMNWSINLKNIHFLTETLSPIAFVNFSNEFGTIILQRRLLTKSDAVKLLPAYDLLKDTLVRKKYMFESVTFNSAYQKVRAAVFTDYDVEGVYQISNSDYSQLIIAFKNKSEIVAGLQTPDFGVNLLFDRFQFDDSTGYYIGSSVVGYNQFVLKFRVGIDRKLTGTLNGIPLAGRKIIKFPDYLSHLNNGREINLAGLYQGEIVYEDGTVDHGELLVSSVAGYLIGNFHFKRQGQYKLDVAFDMGIENNPNGVLYLSSRVSAVPSIHLFRGYLNKNETLSGVWFATSKGKIGKFNLKRVQ